VSRWQWTDAAGRHFVLSPTDGVCQVEDLDIEADLVWGIEPAEANPEGRLRLVIVNPRRMGGGNIENLITSTTAVSGGVLLVTSTAEGWAKLPLIEATRGQESC
jgi:hypothetical protein